MVYKAVPESCSPKLLLKTAPASKSCSQKLFHKAIPQSRSPKFVSKAAPNSCFPKLLKLPLSCWSCFPKLFSKATPKLSFFKIPIRQCWYSPQLSPKLLSKAASQRSSPKFQRCSPKLPQRWSGKLSKVAPQSCSPKLLPKVASKAVPQSYSPKLLSPSCDSANLFAKTAPQSHSAKGLPKAASQNRYRCSPKRSKAITPKLRFFNFIPQNGFPKLFCKAIPESSFRKLLLKASPEVVCEIVPESCCSPKQLFLKIIPEKLLPKAIPSIIIPKAAMVPKANYLHLCGIALEFWR